MPLRVPLPLLPDGSGCNRLGVDFIGGIRMTSGVGDGCGEIALDDGREADFVITFGSDKWICGRSITSLGRGGMTSSGVVGVGRSEFKERASLDSSHCAMY